MPSYILSLNAKEDLLRIYEYGVTKYGAARAERYFNSLFDAFQKIAEQPLLNPASLTRPGYRVYTLLTDTIYYRINNDTVEIIAIIGNQDEGVWVG